jgi:nucleoside-diphosphate-sugar epimerase
VNVAVTGATGFIGRFLCADLARDHGVRAIVRPGGEPLATVPDVATVPDITDDAALARAFGGMGAVVHLAGLAHRLGTSAAEVESEYRRVNVEGTRAVVTAAAAAGVTCVIVASSVKAVGESSDVPWTEDTPPRPQDAYGRSKLEAEDVALQLGRTAGVEVVILRLPLVYGPGAPANVRRLLGLVARGVPLPLGGIRNRRSMLFVGNLAEAIRRLLETAGLGGRRFFVSDGVDVSTPDLVKLMGAGLGLPARLLPVTGPALRVAGRLGDLINRVLPFPLTSAEVERLAGSLAVRIDALREATGFTPPFAPDAAWRETAAWYLGRPS